MAQYTLKEFQKDYPSDAVCLGKIFQMRFGDLKICPKCEKETKFKRITTRRSYQCRLCYHQIYPTAGTPFNKTRTPLTYWFYVMYLMTTTRNGVASKEVERILGVTYKTAYNMTTQIRKLMGSTSKDRKLTGRVEMDETYMGGRSKDGKPGRSTDSKTPVFAMVERLGEVRAEKVSSIKGEVINSIIQKNVDPKAIVNTDEFKLYTNLYKLGFTDHHTINHSIGKYVDGEITTNTIEGYFSHLKRMVKGTHIHVSPKKLQLYIDESCFRYNNRSKEIDMFGTLLSLIPIYRD